MKSANLFCFCFILHKEKMLMDKATIKSWNRRWALQKPITNIFSLVNFLKTKLVIVYVYWETLYIIIHMKDEFCNYIRHWIPMFIGTPCIIHIISWKTTFVSYVTELNCFLGHPVYHYPYKYNMKDDFCNYWYDDSYIKSWT